MKTKEEILKGAGADEPARSFGALRARTLPFLFSLSSFIFCGALFGPLADGASRATQPEGFSFREVSSLEAAGEGVLTASLGGLRTLVADVFWLRAYVMWENRDRASCNAYARAACALAPETVYFRKEYANWLAFDFPTWTVRRLGGRNMPRSEQELILRRDAKSALDWLDAEIKRSPDESNYPLVAGNIAGRRLKDPARAAAYYRKAAETPDAPWYPAMEYTHFLWNAGRRSEALDWVCRYTDRRPAGTQDTGLQFAYSLVGFGRVDEAVAWLRLYAARRPAGSPERDAASALIKEFSSEPAGN